MVVLDDKDLKILALLSENSKLTTSKISRKLLIPITTVHNRIKKLEKNGIIKKYTIKVDYKLIGKPVLSYIFIKVNYNALSSQNLNQDYLIKKIRAIENICSIELVTGDYDLIVKLRVRDLDELSNVITNQIRVITGIERTDTTIVLSELI